MWRFALANFLLLILSAPWFFIGTPDDLTLAGMPAWAAYCVLAAVIYACFVAFAFSRTWGRDDE